MKWCRSSGWWSSKNRSSSAVSSYHRSLSRPLNICCYYNNYNEVIIDDLSNSIRSTILLSRWVFKKESSRIELNIQILKKLLIVSLCAPAFYCWRTIRWTEAHTRESKSVFSFPNQWSSTDERTGNCSFGVDLIDLDVVETFRRRKHHSLVLSINCGGQ